MSQHISPLTVQHKQIILLLPWYINQTLEEADQLLVESHLHDCQVCKGELHSLRRLSIAVNQSKDTELAAAEASFANFRMKLQANSSSRLNSNSHSVRCSISQTATSDSDTSRFGRKRFFGSRYFKPLAIAASIILLITPLALQVSWSPLVTGDYYTLSAPKPGAVAGNKLRVVFSKVASEDSIDRVLKQINGQRVEGPNTVGAYLVSLKGDREGQDINSALAFLRKQAFVVLAEPVN